MKEQGRKEKRKKKKGQRSSSCWIEHSGNPFSILAATVTGSTVTKKVRNVAKPYHL
jgi:hypothetical protein